MFSFKTALLYANQNGEIFMSTNIMSYSLNNSCAMLQNNLKRPLSLKVIENANSFCFQLHLRQSTGC